MAATSVSQGTDPTEPGLQVNWLLIFGGGGDPYVPHMGPYLVVRGLGAVP